MAGDAGVSLGFRGLGFKVCGLGLKFGVRV